MIVRSNHDIAIDIRILNIRELEQELFAEIFDLQAMRQVLPSNNKKLKVKMATINKLQHEYTTIKAW